jgi:resuscitation-promoting factor RpfB
MAEKKTWEEMSKKERVLGLAGLGAIVLLGFGIVNGVASAIGSATQPKQELEAHQVQAKETPKPVTTYKDVQTTEPIPFEKVRRNDATRDVGSEAITTEGVNGIRTLTFHVTYIDGVESGRTQTKSEVTKAPIKEVTSVGTRVPYVPPATTYTTPAPSTSNCDSNYSGCVPIASDVDCAGGSGNGPAYVAGPVRVIGSDIYGLDRDGDGVACE